MVATEAETQQTAAALAAAESEGMPPRPALPLPEPAASGHPQRRWGLVRHAGWVAAVLAVLGVIGVGSVFLVRQRRH